MDKAAEFAVGTGHITPAPYATLQAPVSPDFRKSG